VLRSLAHRRLGPSPQGKVGRQWLLAGHDRCRLVSNELPGATIAHPDREVTIVNVHDRDLGRHPSGHQRGAIALAAPSSAESITATPWGREANVGLPPRRRAGRAAVGGLVVVWKPKPYFRKVRNTLNRFTQRMRRRYRLN
jgi:hypothetical protein